MRLCRLQQRLVLTSLKFVDATSAQGRRHIVVLWLPTPASRCPARLSMLQACLVKDFKVMFAGLIALEIAKAVRNEDRVIGSFPIAGARAIRAKEPSYPIFHDDSWIT